MIQTARLSTLLLSLQLVSALTGEYHPAKPIVLTTDIAIIGGGASGTYAAVVLREDFNKSIVLIEPCDHLGGHTNTYLVPETNTTLDYGVQSYLPYGPALDFFAYFGIQPQADIPKSLNNLNVDVETGEQLPGYVVPSPKATNEAFQKWLTIVSKYEALLEPGYWKFPEPSEIPAEFLVPFEEFTKTNQLEAAVPQILTVSGVGYGGVGELLTFDIFRAFGSSLTKDLLAGKLFRPEGYNSLVYERALELLRRDVLLSSTVHDTKRTPNGVELLIKQGDTDYLVKARRVLYTAPPSIDNLAPFRPDDKETRVFSTFTVDSEFVGVIKAACLPENYSITYLPSAAVPLNQLALHDWPYSLRLDSTGPTGLGLFQVTFGANYTLTEDEFKDLVTKSVRRIQKAGTVAANCDAEFKVIADHTRPVWKQSAKQLQDGFVQDLYALQGYRNIWYTGYAWSAPYSSTVWAFTDTVIARLLEDLDDRNYRAICESLDSSPP